MENANSASGLVGRGARLAYAFVREQIATLLAPAYLGQACQHDVTEGPGTHRGLRHAAGSVGGHVSATTRS